MEIQNKEANNQVVQENNISVVEKDNNVNTTERQNCSSKRISFM